MTVVSELLRTTRPGSSEDHSIFEDGFENFDERPIKNMKSFLVVYIF